MFNIILKVLTKILQIKTDFQKLFFTNEYKELAGKNNSRVWTLTIILLFTFLALGFAIGGLENLRKRMDNPFTNWVDMPVKYEYNVNGAISNIRNHFSKASSRDSFNLKHIGEYIIDTWRFTDQKNQKEVYKIGRTINFEEDAELLDKILSKSDGNLLMDWRNGNNNNAFKNCGIIVTRQMLDALGYKKPLKQKKVSMVYNIRDDVKYTLYLDVIAVVKELPNFCDFICTPKMSNLQLNPNRSGFLRTEDYHNNFYFLSDNQDEKVVSEKVKQFLDTLPVYKVKKETIELVDDTPTALYEVIFDYGKIGKGFKDKELLAFYKQLTKQFSKTENIRKYKKWECSDGYDFIEKPYYLAYNFKDLEKVRAFKEFMKTNFEVDIDMGQVEAKENFHLVTLLTYALSVILFIFSIASIVFFVNSMLLTHLQKVKMNLGTFKAFGLSNSMLITTYLKIIFAFIFIAVLSAFIIAIIIQTISNTLTIEHYLNIFNFKVIIATLILFAVSLIISNYTIRKILDNTPGDLIYNR